jgi:hypothetical protein
MIVWILLGALLVWWVWGSRRSDPRSTKASPPHNNVDVERQTPPPPALAEPPVITSDPAKASAFDVKRCEVEILEGVCMVCRSVRSDRFVTRRGILCQRCVKLLCESAPVDVYAIDQAISNFNTLDYIDWGFIEQVLNDDFSIGRISKAITVLQLQSNDRGHSRDWLKFMRAYHLGLISGGVRITRPSDDEWTILAHRIRLEDGLRCCLCGIHNVALHVHHMVHLSRYGTNDPRNLVSLCYRCHRAQHPQIHFCLDAPAENLPNIEVE